MASCVICVSACMPDGEEDLAMLADESGEVGIWGAGSSPRLVSADLPFLDCPYSTRQD